MGYQEEGASFAVRWVECEFWNGMNTVECAELSVNCKVNNGKCGV